MSCQYNFFLIQGRVLRRQKQNFFFVSLFVDFRQMLSSLPIENVHHLANMEKIENNLSKIALPRKGSHPQAKM